MPLSLGRVFSSMKQLFLLISPQNMEISGFCGKLVQSITLNVSMIYVCDKYEVRPLRFVKKEKTREPCLKFPVVSED